MEQPLLLHYLPQTYLKQRPHLLFQTASNSEKAVWKLKSSLHKGHPMHYQSLNVALEQYSGNLTHHPASPNSLALHIDCQTQGYLKLHTPDGISLSLTCQDEPVSGCSSATIYTTFTSSAATPKAGETWAMKAFHRIQRRIHQTKLFAATHCHARQSRFLLDNRKRHG